MWLMSMSLTARKPRVMRSEFEGLEAFHPSETFTWFQRAQQFKARRSSRGVGSCKESWGGWGWSDYKR